MLNSDQVDLTAVLEQRLSETFIGGVFWSSMSNYLGFIIRWPVVLIVSGLLTPNDFGLYAAALVMTAWLALFRDFGFNTALMYYQDDVQRTATAAFWVVLVIAIVLTSIGVLSAPLIAMFFDNPDVTPVARVVSFSFVISALSSIHSTLNLKNLHYGRMAFLNILNAVCYAGCTLFLAYNGAGVWSLVYGVLFSGAVTTVAYWILSPFVPSLTFPLDRARHMFRFGGFAALRDLSIYGYLSLPPAIIGQTLGTEKLGFFSFASRISDIPSQRIGAIIHEVAFPIFTRFQKEMSVVKRVYLNTTRYLVLSIVPISVFIIFLGPAYLELLYDDKWEPAMNILRILGVHGMVVAIAAPTGLILLSLGKPEVHFKIVAIEIVLVVPLLFFVANTWGLLGAVAFVTVSHVLFCGWTTIMANRLIGVSVKEYVSCFYLPMGVGLSSAGMIFSVNSGWGFFTHPSWGILLVVSTGYFLAYLVLVVAIGKKVRRETILIILALLGQLRARWKS